MRLRHYATGQEVNASAVMLTGVKTTLIIDGRVVARSELANYSVIEINQEEWRALSQAGIKMIHPGETPDPSSVLDGELVPTRESQRPDPNSNSFRNIESPEQATIEEETSRGPQAPPRERQDVPKPRPEDHGRQW